MKRSISDSDTDVFYDERDLMKADGSPSQSCHRSDRKRRRGVIEKRRRDRINNSLTELRRLVPAAFEKQDSAKLEKAEILQMTVDHLKTLHAKGVSGYNLDTTVLALEYRTVGFRECTAEVARYLISVEGMDIQDPLRLRLMSHLQCYCAQREAAARASLQNSSWGHHHLTTAGPSHTQYGNGGVVAPTMVQQQHPSQAEQLAAAAAHSSTLSSYMDSSGGRGVNHPQTGDGGNHGSGGMAVMRLQPPSGVTMGSHISSTGSTGGQMAAPVLSGLSSVHSQFLGVNSVAMLSPNGFHYNSNMSNQSVKPYRPWGSELVY